MQEQFCQKCWYVDNCVYNCIMLHVIIGGLGFIGEHLIRSLLSESKRILIVDIDIWGRSSSDTSSSSASASASVSVLKPNNLMWSGQVAKIVKNEEIFIWHLAANSDILKGSSSSLIDYELTLGSTVQVYELAKMVNTTGIAFTSSSAVYGQSNATGRFFENSETKPISNYGLMKLASENLLSILSKDLQIPVHIFRLANIVGPKMTHGVIIDFIRKCKADPDLLQVLGDGNQTKTYLHIDDLIYFMENIVINGRSSLTNLGPGDAGVSVAVIAELVIRALGQNNKIVYGNTPHGWFGDVSRSLMGIEKLSNAVHFESLSSRAAVKRAIIENLL